MTVQLEKVKWLKDYELGDPRLDGDHRRLVGVVNLVVKSLNESRMTESLALMRQFLEMARAHFAAEEALMHERKFANIERHKQYHQRLLDSAERIEKACEFVRDEEYVREAFVDFVYCLLDDVIQGDKELLPLLKGEQA